MNLHRLCPRVLPRPTKVDGQRDKGYGVYILEGGGRVKVNVQDPTHGLTEVDHQHLKMRKSLLACASPPPGMFPASLPWCGPILGSVVVVCFFASLGCFTLNSRRLSDLQTTQFITISSTTQDEKEISSNSNINAVKETAKTRCKESIKSIVDRNQSDCSYFIVVRKLRLQASDCPA